MTRQRRIQSIGQAHRKMTFSLSEANTPAPVSAKVTSDDLIVHLADGRIIVTPLAWYPPLMAASRDQRRKVLLGPAGIHWPDLDEDLSVAAMLAGVIPTYQR
jgi:uncharacterized protein DUF2442